jgi:hypothetical protein
MLKSNRWNDIPEHETGQTSQRVAAVLRAYFRSHPEVSKQYFLLHAMERELADRQRRERTLWRRTAAVGEIRMGHSNPARTRPTDQELRIAGLLAKRVMAIHRRRYALWARIQRFVEGNRM